jgi:hypothetical protein
MNVSLGNCNRRLNWVGILICIVPIALVTAFSFLVSLVFGYNRPKK